MTVLPTHKKRVKVTLLGQKFTIKSDKSDEYLEALIKFVDKQLEHINSQTQTISTHQVALLATLNLGDQLLQKEEELSKLKNELKDRTQNALKEVDDALSMLPHHQIEMDSNVNEKTPKEPIEHESVPTIVPQNP